MTPEEERQLRADVEQLRRDLQQQTEARALIGFYDDGSYRGKVWEVDVAGAGVQASRFGHRLKLDIPGGGLLGGGGVVHYDYVVDSSYTGTDGTSVTLGTGATVIIYTTVQAAITAADAENTDITILINEGVNAGVYNEAVTIAATWASGHDLWLIGEGIGKIQVGLTTGDALTISSGSPTLYFKNIRFRGASASHSVTGTASNITAQFEDCIFARSVSADFGGAFFRRCDFEEGYDVDTGHSPSTVQFESCTLTGTSLWVGTVQRHNFVNCRWSGSADIIQLNGSGSFGADFTGCILETSGVAKTFMDIIDGAATLRFSDCWFGGPGTNGNIYVESTADANITITVNGCTFQANGTNPYVKFARLGRLLLSGCWMEDNGSIDITGIFQNSTFGPNYPPDTNVQLDATSATNMYVGTGTVSGAAATTGLVPLPQRGAGVPSHTAPEGTPYWDTTNNRLYVNNDGATAWTALATGAVVAAPADADYLVGTANATLTGEIVAGTVPGGELGGTWGSPTVDAVHGGTHAIAQGGTGQTTAQAAIDALSAVAAATNEHVLTKDTATGNAIFKAGGAGGGAPTTATYVTISLDGTLSAERTLAVGTDLILTDAGANAAVTISAEPLIGLALMGMVM